MRTSSGSFLSPLRQPSHHTTGTPCKFLSFRLPCPQVFKHNNLNEIMRETHSNAVEGTVLLLREQRELIESTGKKELEGKRKKGEWSNRMERRRHTHTHNMHTHTDAGQVSGNLNIHRRETVYVWMQRASKMATPPRAGLKSTEKVPQPLYTLSFPRATQY